MRESVVIIIILCLIPIAAFLLHNKRRNENKKEKKEENSALDGFFGLLLGCFAISLLPMGLVNGLSSEVITVNGYSKSECETHDFFLLYSAKNQNGKTKFYFLKPYSNEKVYNNTEGVVDYKVVKYSYYGSGDAEILDTSYQIEPHSLFNPHKKIETIFLFEPISKHKDIYKKTELVAYRGILLQHNDSISYK